ncbi:hypothetical protein ABW21_db0202697 [Orbilia brochopaga]|nr:hypothetical protein ABW21_db0202697 [Drechslerella brochopaga]
MSAFSSNVHVPELASSRSLSDLQGENRAAAARPPTRTVSLASALLNGSKVSLSERPIRAITQIRAPQQSPAPQPDRLRMAPLRVVDDLQENQGRPRIASGASETKAAAATEPHEDAAFDRHKENLAPTANSQADLDTNALAVAKDGFTIYEDSSLSLDDATPTDMRPPTPNINAPWSPTPEDFDTAIERDALLDTNFDEGLIHELQCMYGPPSDPRNESQSDFSLKLLRAIKDDFEGKYKAAFDVFYNTRRFFGQPCGTILDTAHAEEQVIGCGTVTGKSIYGVYVEKPHAYESDAETEQYCSAPPNTPNAIQVPRAANLNSQILHETTEPDNHKTGAPREQSGDGLQSNKCDNEPSRPKSRQLSLPSRRFPIPQLSTSVSTYNSLPNRRNTVTPPRRQHPAFLASPPRSPLSSGRKKNSPLRPKAVMAWWKERDAAASINNAPNNAPIARPHSRPSSSGSMSSLSNDEFRQRGGGRHKKRNPLRRLSSLFAKPKSSHGSQASMGLSNDFLKSSNSLPSQVFLPECEHGTPSFITSTIIKNSK